MDCYDEKKRSAIMAAVSSKNTKPELFLRKLLFAAGFRYRINVGKLPGKPDIVLTKYRTAIFVHGCFWHFHSGCSKAKVPETHRNFWEEKLRKNRERDEKEIVALKAAGWRVLVVWECACRNRLGKILLAHAEDFIRDGTAQYMEIGRQEMEKEIKP